jgi:hypothetical protein
MDARPTHPTPETSAPSSTSPTPTGRSTGSERCIPTARYEAGADIGPDEWTNLKIDIHNTHLNILVNGTQALSVAETKATPATGAVGLFVDIGSESYFSNLTISPR